MNILLIHVDGRLPNLALMRIAQHYRIRGHRVVLRRAGNARAIEPRLDDPPHWDLVFASLIFEHSRPLGERIKTIYPGARLGGTGWDVASSLEAHGITDETPDYSLYPGFQQSIGFTQRGCRLRCSFCVVPRKEGAVREVFSISDIWRGEPWPREVILLDNDFFGQPNWQARLNELRDGSFKVSFCQGINARMLTDEAAAAIASVDYRNDRMDTRRIYTAWDNRKDEHRLVAGLHTLMRYGVKPRHIMVYMLIGYWPGETHEDREHRRSRLRELGVLPYPMPYVRTPELLGFQRWVVYGYDKTVPWAEWARSRYHGKPFDPRGQEMLFPVPA